MTWIWVAFSLVMLAGPGGFSTRAAVLMEPPAEIHAAVDFVSPLGADGVWVEVESFGRCWRPSRVGTGWQPYSNGDWVWTENGWYWMSDEPWAWACYHYGRWIYSPSHAWVWVPGVDWAPAWVTWRTGGGVVGWTPLPPQVGFGQGDVIRTTAAEFAPEHFVFVETSHFIDHITPKTLIPNSKIPFDRTTEITNIKRAYRLAGGSAPTIVFNEGPGLAAVGYRVRSMPLQEAIKETPVPAEVMRKYPSEPESEVTSENEPTGP